MIWRMVKNRLSNLSKRYYDRLREFKAATNRIAWNERWEYCVGFVDQVMPGPTGNLFTKIYFDENKKKAVRDIFDRVKTAFSWNIVNNIHWIENSSKYIAIEIIRDIAPNIGYADFYQNKTYLDEELKQVIITKKDFFENVIRLLNHAAQRKWSNWSFNKLGRSHYEVSPTSVVSVYSPVYNTIFLPAALLQPPFFWGGAYISSFQYGAIGSIVGHEISHAIDNNKLRYYPNGQPWFTHQSVSAFNKRKKCLIRQYDNYFWKTGKKHVDGEQTLVENIADNGGIRQSFQAYRTLIGDAALSKPLPGINLTNDQLFFIGFANVRCGKDTSEVAPNKIHKEIHSPGKFRVIGPLSNFDEFTRAFLCPEVAPMNRGNQSCRIW